MRVKMERALGRLKNRAIGAAFEQWVSQCAGVNGTRNKMTQVMARIQNRTISGAFDRWAEMTEEAVR